jgi:hypothetical protein
MDRCACGGLAAEPKLTERACYHRCHKSAFVQVLYYVIITLFVQIILTQRSDTLWHSKFFSSLLVLQDLRDNAEEQVGRRNLVRNRRRPARCWDLFFCPCCTTSE